MKSSNIFYIIPARVGSKGLPLKNRRLIKYAFPVLKNFSGTVIISTDDEQIKQKYNNHFLIHDRSKKTSSDTASMKSVLREVIKYYQLNKNDILVTLYLTYPQRKKKDVQNAIEYFLNNKSDSLLCCKPVKTHPYLCIYKDGSQVVNHDMYRRQDYPEAFEISHFISITKAGALKKLNNNLYNKDTLFYHIDDKIDVDDKKDLEEFENSAMHITGR